MKRNGVRRFRDDSRRQEALQLLNPNIALLYRIRRSSAPSRDMEIAVRYVYTFQHGYESMPFSSICFIPSPFGSMGQHTSEERARSGYQSRKLRVLCPPISSGVLDHNACPNINASLALDQAPVDGNRTCRL